MTAIDHFTKQQGFSKTPYDREQFGGSLGLRNVKDRWFIFGAVERSRRNSAERGSYGRRGKRGFWPRRCHRWAIVPAPGVSQPFRDTMYTFKTDYQVNPKHSLFVRWADQLNNKVNAQLQQTQADLGVPNVNDNRVWNVTEGTPGSWATMPSISHNRRRSLRAQPVHDRSKPAGDPQPTVSVGHGRPLDGERISFFVQGQSGGKRRVLPPTGQARVEDWRFVLVLSKDRLTLNIGGCGRMGFFDDRRRSSTTPMAVTAGFVTPGVVSNIIVGSCSAGGATRRTGGLRESDYKQKQFDAYVQDDWRLTPRLIQLNLGVRRISM
jgi:hypothetical protein